MTLYHEFFRTSCFDIRKKIDKKINIHINLIAFNLQKGDIDKDIKDCTKKLKELLAQKQGLTVEQLEFRQKEKAMKSNNLSQSVPKFIKEKKIDVTRFRGVIFNFQCPECKGYNTKRSGIAYQVNSKARILCFDCRYKKQVTNDKKITPFFTLSNEEMIEQIKANKDIDEDKKQRFYEKYLIKGPQEKI